VTIRQQKIEIEELMLCVKKLQDQIEYQGKEIQNFKGCISNQQEKCIMDTLVSKNNIKCLILIIIQQHIQSHQLAFK